MIHWAKIDDDNNVVWVLAGDESHEDNGYEWITSVNPGRWIETSKEMYGGVHLSGGTPLRKNYAGIGFKYDSDKDAFIPPKPPFDSWILNDDTCLWEAPVPRPDNDNFYSWNEETLSWDEVNNG